MLIRRSQPRRTQPQGGAQIDRSHPLARGLQFVQVGDIAQNMADFEVRSSGSGSPTEIVGTLGRARRYQDTADFYVAPGLDAGTDWGMLVVADVSLMNTWGGVMAHTSNLGTTQGWAAWQLINDSTWNCYGASGSPVGGLSISSEIVGKTGIALAASYEAGIGTQMWLNGLRRAAVTGTAGAAAPGAGYLKVASSRDSAAMTGAVYAAYAWSRGLSTPEIEALQEDPWAFFVPLRRRIYVDMGAGSVVLVVDDMAHAHTLEAIALTQQHLLSVDGAAHPVTFDALALEQQHVLTIDDAEHPTTMGSVALLQQHVLAISDAVHAMDLEAVTLAIAGALSVHDMTHANTLADVALVQQNTLSVADMVHQASIDTVNLSADVVLAIADAIHPHTIETPTLSTAIALIVQDMAHAMHLDGVALSQAHVLVVSDMHHEQLMPALQLALPGAAIHVGDRYLVIRGESRALLIAAESRVLTIH